MEKEKPIQEHSRILTTKGYSIRKCDLTPQQTEQLQKELFVTPKMNTKFATKAMLDAASFKLYRESPGRWYVPRSWGIQQFGPPDLSVVPEGLEMPVTSKKFLGAPYDYQEEIISKFINAGANGLVCVPCGKGKTFMALAIAARLGRRFLVVVDKEFLMNQWKGEMQALMPGLRIGIFQENLKQIGTEVIEAPMPTLPELKEMARVNGLRVGGTKEELVQRLTDAGVKVRPDPTIIEYDCCIAMIQTVVQRDLAADEFKDYGFTIFDECHHLGAQHFSKVLQRIQTRWMLGLSATPVREDGLTKVFQWYLGDPVYWEKTREPDPTVVVKAVYIKTEDADYHDVPVDWKGEPVMARLLGNVLSCADRNEEIVRWILELCNEHPSRRVLVLSERIGHLNEIEERVKNEDPSLTMSYYIGGMKETVREEGASTARILLASYAMASEAMNIKTLNSVILASPRKSVEQSTGRILRIRPEHRQIEPVIVDIIDEHSMYQGQWRKRSTYYKKCHYQIERWGMNGKRLKSEHFAKEHAVIENNECLFLDDD